MRALLGAGARLVPRRIALRLGEGELARPAYPAAFLAAAALWAEAPRRRLAAAALASAAAGTLYLHLALVLPALPFPAADDVTRGWHELAARVAEEVRRLPAPAFVMGCSYKPASELAYYLPGRPVTYAQNAMGEPGLAYGYWEDPALLSSRDAHWRGGGLARAGLPRRAERCQPLEELVPLAVLRGGRKVTSFRLWRCRYVPAPAHQGVAR